MNISELLQYIPEIFQTALKNIGLQLVYDPKAPMLFSSGLFWMLFLIFLPIYSLVKGSKWKMVVFVVLFSLYFYYKSSGLFFLMLIGTSLVDWGLSHWIYRIEKRGGKLAVMWLSILISLSILGYFKYANFFLWNWNQMVEGNFQPLEIILPVGISFYTFQSISYIKGESLLHAIGLTTCFSFLSSPRLSQVLLSGLIISFLRLRKTNALILV